MLSFLPYTMAQAVTTVPSGSRGGDTHLTSPSQWSSDKLILIRPCGMGHVWMQPSLENTSATLSFTNTQRYSYKDIDHSTTCNNKTMTKMFLRKCQVDSDKIQGKRKPHLQ